MEVKIGVQYASRELVIETSLSSDEIEAVTRPSPATGVLSRPTPRAAGHRPDEKLAYVELGTPTAGQVGFRS